MRVRDSRSIDDEGFLRHPECLGNLFCIIRIMNLRAFVAEMFRQF